MVGYGREELGRLGSKRSCRACWISTAMRIDEVAMLI